MQSKTSKKKKALVLFGSPKKDGFTMKMLQCFLNALPPGYDITFFSAYERKVAPCIACGLCEKEDACVYHDMDEMDRLLRTVDLLIVATPIYNLGFPSPLKAVLDRTQRYFSARFARGVKPPIEKQKESVLLLSCGADDTVGAQMMERQLKMIYTVINARLREVILWKNTDRDDKMDCVKERLIKAAEDC